VWPWFEIDPIGKRRTENFTIEQIRLDTYRSEIRSFLHLVLYTGLDLDPVYQRGIVWDADDRTKLLDSVFAGRSIGAFITRRLKFQSGLPYYNEIVDGKQRVTTLVDFFLGRFKYRGVGWDELSWADHNTFETFPITRIEVGEDVTDVQVLGLFVSVNDTGKPVSQEHIQRVKLLLSNSGESKV
jgi:uncharacterized protein with ParB-like and HNH nuclease domain